MKLNTIEHVGTVKEQLKSWPYPRKTPAPFMHGDVYFERSTKVLNFEKQNPNVTLQFFTKKAGILAGVLEGIAVFGEFFPFGRPKILALPEGSSIQPWEPVLVINGDYTQFAELETIILGVLARRSLVATNASRSVAAANGKRVIFMGARHEDWVMQGRDGYAVWVGGIRQTSTRAACVDGSEPVGTIPHALIAAFRGDSVKATVAFAKWVRETGQDIPVTALVDFGNNCALTAVQCCRAVRDATGKPPFAVRLDTSEKLIDYGIINSEELGKENLLGVNPFLVRHVRKMLDAAFFEDVKIVVSGGFTPKKIKTFEDQGVPVDIYGVGSSILGHGREEDGVLNSMDFTADIVEPVAKVGRYKGDYSKLERVF